MAPAHLKGNVGAEAIHMQQVSKQGNAAIALRLSAIE
jgi:hypothetical protein